MGNIRSPWSLDLYKNIARIQIVSYRVTFERFRFSDFFPRDGETRLLRVKVRGGLALASWCPPRLGDLRHLRWTGPVPMHFHMSRLYCYRASVVDLIRFQCGSGYVLVVNLKILYIFFDLSMFQHCFRHVFIIGTWLCL